MLATFGANLSMFTVFALCCELRISYWIRPDLYIPFHCLPKFDHQLERAGKSLHIRHIRTSLTILTVISRYFNIDPHSAKFVCPQPFSA